MEFHISSQARKKYKFKASLFRYDGNVIFADFHAVRRFADQLNAVRRESGDREQVYPGLINAMGLIDEIMHHVIHEFKKAHQPDLNQRAYEKLKAAPALSALDDSLMAFCDAFPPGPVYQEIQTVPAYFAENNPLGEPNRYEVVEELLVLWITNRNPAAMKAFDDLFDEKTLREKTAYSEIVRVLTAYIETLPKIEGMSLVEFLLLPAKLHPDSLFDQLDFIRRNWSAYLGDFLRRLLMSMDWMREEARDHGFGPGEVRIPVYSDGAGGFGEDEYEAFSQDREWMPRLVLIAKNVYVWLDQLSREYGSPIRTLDQIPDETLRTLADQGFTGLWLIGLWERSAASARIKQLCGNPEALASAYSLRSYQIASDLGGEEALRGLEAKTRRFGIRLASDMVPNHMGIDSEWVLYRPDLFLSLPYSPFPSYTFNGPNLSPDPNIGIFIEDHYYTREDAAVVFKRVDFNTGDTRYIYHGNDGTTMPWNDTAQLNYLNPEVRELVTQTIIGVARRFPIIRFDAAMTLTKRHYQRLWFPEPGTGGDIATRSEYGLTKAEFDRAFPEEFWRNVVDRIAAEVPDTLLLAEAFWLMEGYFVRTLGMHRVYNSAFMNILRDEDNAKYRVLIKTTLDFEPEILKRYVNFMNNPDEKTAAEQFGKGDKYFGILAMMVTIPGLPMFGHGQLQGFTEKYGMEYRRAYWDEQVDWDLMRRHEREIFPLLHQRRRFAEVDNFRLYNFATGYGNTDENVFAYSNFGEGKKSLFVYNNRYGDTQGFVRQSVPYIPAGSTDKATVETTLGDALGLRYEPDRYVILHDEIRKQYFIRPSIRLMNEGLFLSLGAYEYYVFNDIYEIHDDLQGSWGKLCAELGDRGTEDIYTALQELALKYILDPFRWSYDGAKLRWLEELVGTGVGNPDVWQQVVNGTWPDFERLANLFNTWYGVQGKDTALMYDGFIHGVREMLTLPGSKAVPGMAATNQALEKFDVAVRENPGLWVDTYLAATLRFMAESKVPSRSAFPPVDLFRDWFLERTLSAVLSAAGFYLPTIPEQVETIRWLYLIGLDRLRAVRFDTIDLVLDDMLEAEETRVLLRVNTFEGVRWFNREMAELLGRVIRIGGYYALAFDPTLGAAERNAAIRAVGGLFETFQARVEASEYRYDRMIAMKAAVADEGAEKVSEAVAEKTGEAPEKRKKKIGAETSAAKKAEGKPKARKKAKDSDEPKEPKRRARKSEKKEGEEKK